MTVVDVHTHMLGERWFETLREHGPPHYTVGTAADGRECILCDGAQFLTPAPAHFDYALRLREMDAAGVDLAIVSLTSPNVYFGDEAVSSRAAEVVNDEMAEAQGTYPDRIRWMASLPWEYPDAAVAELKRARGKGAVGVIVGANINERHLTEPGFAPVWQAIDDLALPVLVHPSAPPGTEALRLDEYQLASAIGFMFDTTLAVGRMIFDGFLDRYPDLRLIVPHAGATIPYLIGRFDRIHEQLKGARVRIERRPSAYLDRLCYDTVTYRPEALQMCIDAGGLDNMLYGSDFPHTIGDMKGCLARVDALPAASARAIRSENARRIFGL